MWYQAGCVGAPPFEATITKRSPSREYTRGDVRSTLVFARTREEREQRGDPRPSIAERYASREAYLAAVRAAAVTLAGARHALPEDVVAMVERAGQRWDWVMAGGP